MLSEIPRLRPLRFASLCYRASYCFAISFSTIVRLWIRYSCSTSQATSAGLSPIMISSFCFFTTMLASPLLILDLICMSLATDLELSIQFSFYRCRLREPLDVDFRIGLLDILRGRYYSFAGCSFRPEGPGICLKFYSTCSLVSSLGRSGKGIGASSCGKVAADIEARSVYFLAASLD